MQLGLVTYVSDELPALNWVYVDKETRQLRYGNRTMSIAHEVGPWGFEAGEEGGAGGLTFDGVEGAVAVETEEGWEVRWEDGEGKVGDVGGRRVLSVSLERRFVEEPKGKEDGDAGKAAEKKPAAKTSGRFEVTSTTVQKEKGSNKPATKTESKIELSRSTKTMEEEDKMWYLDHDFPPPSPFEITISKTQIPLSWTLADIPPSWTYAKDCP